VKEKLILLLGETGTGKSTFVEKFVGLKEGTLSSSRFQSQTTMVSATKKDEYVLLDTPGLNDTEDRSQVFMDQLITKCSEYTQIDYVVIFFNMRRFNTNQKEILRVYLDMIGWVDQDVTICLTGDGADEISTIELKTMITALFKKEFTIINWNKHDNSQFKSLCTSIASNRKPFISKNMKQVTLIKTELEQLKKMNEGMKERLNEAKADQKRLNDMLVMQSTKISEQQIKEIERHHSTIDNLSRNISENTQMYVEYSKATGVTMTKKKCGRKTQKGTTCQNSMNCYYRATGVH